MSDVRKEKARAAALAGLAADSLALGAHWIYDVEHLAAIVGVVDELRAPGEDSYHAGKRAGDFTHYGDQTLVLLQSLAARRGFDLHDFCARWKALFADYPGYVDGATRNTLKKFEFGDGPETSGANSHDLAGASRIAPLVLACRDNLDDLLDAARAQTKMTHNNAQIIESAAFFARVAWLSLDGVEPVPAMREAAKADCHGVPVAQWVEMGIESAGVDTLTAIGRFGQSCSVEGAFPGVVHLLARYPNDLRACVVECVMAGGDSSARAMLAAMVLAARLGPRAIPASWADGMARAREIRELLNAL